MYKVVLPKTEDELKKYYQFRYKIMCEELGHIKKNKNNFDIDEYDRYSLHLMAIDKNNQIVATMRVIYNSPQNYPTLKHIKLRTSDNISKKSSCEISRVFIDKNIRSIQNSKEIIYKLVSEVYNFSNKHDINFFYAALEENFLRFLKIIKIEFTIIGKQVEFYGLRFPCIISANKLFKYNPYIN